MVTVAVLVSGLCINNHISKPAVLPSAKYHAVDADVAPILLFPPTKKVLPGSYQYIDRSTTTPTLDSTFTETPPLSFIPDTSFTFLLCRQLDKILVVSWAVLPSWSE